MIVVMLTIAVLALFVLTLTSWFFNDRQRS
jgi:hypothetical protein